MVTFKVILIVRDGKLLVTVRAKVGRHGWKSIATRLVLIVK